MADEEYTYDNMKVCYSSEDECYYAIPDQLPDRYFDPRIHGKKARWIDDNDNPDDLGGHFELIPDGEDHENPVGEPIDLEPAEAHGGSDFG